MSDRPSNAATEESAAPESPSRTSEFVLRRDVVSFARRDGRLPPKIRGAWRPDHDAFLVEPQRGPREASLDPSWVFDAARCFGRAAPLVVEIGSGTGGAILASAKVRPDWDHLAVEVYRPGVTKTILRAARLGLTNLRVLSADAACLLRTGLPDASVREVRVFFPDPWPKLKHHKRRLVSASMVADVTRVLEPGGAFRLATDWPDYADQMLRLVSAQPGLDNPHEGWAPRWDGRPVTTFERRGVHSHREIRDLVVLRGGRIMP